jgi:hypothetical protein
VAAMGLERELFRLDVLQARKQLSFIQAFMPEEILSRDNESLLLLLTLDRLVFKSKLLMGHLQSYYKLDQLSFNLINDVEVQHTNDELLFAWELYWGVSKVRDPACLLSSINVFVDFLTHGWVCRVSSGAILHVEPAQGHQRPKCVPARGLRKKRTCSA